MATVDVTVCVDTLKMRLTSCFKFFLKNFLSGREGNVPKKKLGVKIFSYQSLRHIHTAKKREYFNTYVAK